MSETVMTLLMQIPLAGVVVFVVMVFLKHIEKAEVATSQVLKDLTDQIAKTNIYLISHDEKTDAYLEGMQKKIAGNKEKTQPRK
jgi:hypothetical protein